MWNQTCMWYTAIDARSKVAEGEVKRDGYFPDSTAGFAVPLSAVGRGSGESTKAPQGRNDEQEQTKQPC